MNKKIHGYYSVNGKTFDTKVHALIYASNILNSADQKLYNQLVAYDSLVKWHFNDEVFDSYNWTVEPEQSLESLYLKRARELRERYDYLIIYYSGGCDSHNMVMSFLNQGLKIDEIVVHHVDEGIELLENYGLDITSAKMQPLTETKFQVVPRLKEISTIDPSIKIKMFDTSQKTIDTFSSSQSGDWVLKVREELNPIDSSKYNFTCFDEYKKAIETNKKIGILVGLDKPSLKIEDGKIHLVFLDRRFNINLFYTEVEKYSNAQLEFFYSSPDACDLICKQAHSLKNWILSSKDNLKAFISVTNSDAATAKLYLEENARLVLYPNTWKPEWFQAKKSVLDWHSEADLWFHVRFTSESTQGSCWREGIRYIRKHVDKSFLLSYNDLGYDGFRVFTKQYSLT